MQYWQDGGMVTLLYVAVLILAARQLHRSVPLVRALAVPPVLVAGLVGLLLGGGGPNSRNQQLNVVIVHPSPRLKPVNQFYTVYNCHAKQSFVRKQLTRGTLN